MNTTQLELATIRAQLMDKYNDIMATYIYEHNISESKAEKLHDTNVSKTDIIAKKYMMASFTIDKETHISNLLNIYNKLNKEGPKQVLKFCQLILYIIGEIDELEDSLVVKSENGFVFV